MNDRPLTDAEKAAAAELRAELSEWHLCVELMPAPRPMHEGHMVRVVTGANPSWYSQLSRSFPSKRRRNEHHRRRNSHDPDLRRYLVERSLDRLASGVCRHRYDHLLRPIVESFARSQRASA